MYKLYIKTVYSYQRKILFHILSSSEQTNNYHILTNKWCIGWVHLVVEFASIGVIEKEGTRSKR